MMIHQDTLFVPAMPSLRTDDPRWTQVLTRAAAADGRFVYAVQSTGVFCRPTCPSRRPRREQVRFFDHPRDAEHAGFRACLRCAPQGARPAHPAARAVAKAASYLRMHATESVALADLAAHVGLSASHLQRVFTAHTGISPRGFQAACRAEGFRRALRTGHDVTTATYEAGYGSPSRVSAHKPTGRGLTPAAYRRGAAGETIRYALVPCALGRLLVAATARGVCAVKLGAVDKTLVADLAAEFPAADVQPGDLPRAWVDSVSRAVDQRPAVAAEVPLDVQGTAFQWKVWKSLQAIPAGETRTYAALAEEIGRPTAARAVARACATNPVAIVVPCHRVVPAAGGTGGYRWGSARKAALLRLEAGDGDPAKKRR
ncbi:MAG TPA: bifunctional DNA-binding transcriptional regulator/O6-methylguanine-DNA methyltransferase Ada [Vicinamibacterales bacterium]|nr:bifunctional DNA-binding transcriptional regulator/O6-methylguanine-DNA methyltransferase Ada [Vicinamibacterales bacterium]